MSALELVGEGGTRRRLVMEDSRMKRLALALVVL
jgi:hypothetical protein